MTTKTKTSGTRGIKFQERDFKLLKDLFECRLFTIDHAGVLYFKGSYGSAKRRLHDLRDAGLLRVKSRGVNEPAVHFFTHKAFQLLREHGHLTEYGDWNWGRILQKRADVSDRTIRHELAVMDVKSALQPAIEAQAHLRIMEFGTWPALYEFKANRTLWDKKGAPSVKAMLIKPDGFLRLREHAPGGGTFEHDFFVEVDMGTEVRAILIGKASAYQDHYRRGGHARRQGGKDARREEYPFRVLMIFKNAEQRNNLCERLMLARVGATQVWTAAMADVVATPLAKIWIRPMDYQHAINGSPFTPRPGRAPIYVRRPEREEWIERRAVRHALLDDPGFNHPQDQ